MEERELRKLLHTKQEKVLLNKGLPNDSVGNNGDSGYFYVVGKGVYHGIKFNNAWYFKIYLNKAQTLEQEINNTVENITVNSITVTDASGIDHGGLGGLTDDDHTQYIRHALATAISDFLVASGSGAYIKKTLAETGAILEGDIEHDNLQAIPVNDHIDHTSVSIIAGDGLQDGGTIDANVTINIDVSDFVGLGLKDDGSENIDLDLWSLSTVTFAPNLDFVPLLDQSDSYLPKKVKWSSIIELIDGDGLTSSPNTGVLDVGAGNGITVNANDIEVIYEANNPTTIEPNDTADAGLADEASRGDHQHPIATAAAGTIEPDDSASEGVSTSFSRSDHKHSIATAVVISVDLSANAEGVSTSFARADHQHQLDESIAPAWTGVHTWSQTCTFLANLEIDGILDINNAYQLNYSINIMPESQGRAYSHGTADYFENYSILVESVSQSSSYDTSFYV